MTFDEWKAHQVDVGLLSGSRRRDCICYPYTTKVGWGKKYQSHIVNCQTQGKVTKLSFNEYLYKCFEANITIDQIGKSGNSSKVYQLGRIDDTGEYTVNTCRFITMKQNSAERVQNGGSTTQANKIRGIKNPSKGFVHLGKSNYRYVGDYVTPMGRFITTKDAAIANGCGTMTGYDRCKKCDRVIGKQATHTLRTLGQHALGKTYRELGWYFERLEDGRT